MIFAINSLTTVLSSGGPHNLGAVGNGEIPVTECFERIGLVFLEVILSVGLLVVKSVSVLGDFRIACDIAVDTKFHLDIDFGIIDLFYQFVQRRMCFLKIVFGQR